MVPSVDRLYGKLLEKYTKIGGLRVGFWTCLAVTVILFVGSLMCFLMMVNAVGGIENLKQLHNLPPEEVEAKYPGVMQLGYLAVVLAVVGSFTLGMTLTFFAAKVYTWTKHRYLYTILKVLAPSGMLTEKLTEKIADTYFKNPPKRIGKRPRNIEDPLKCSPYQKEYRDRSRKLVLILGMFLTLAPCCLFMTFITGAWSDIFNMVLGLGVLTLIIAGIFMAEKLIITDRVRALNHLLRLSFIYPYLRRTGLLDDPDIRTAYYKALETICEKAEASPQCVLDINERNYNVLRQACEVS